MPRRRVNWLGWGRYYSGRLLQLVGLVVVGEAVFLFFGSSNLRAMLGMTAAGASVFFLGWLAARKNPEAK